ncbi:mitochondrial fission ELM1 family protein [Nisaea nitritireducens]|uniref:mitochondrial fission ELM1 family protein n=1 Tax=Nisaea nitritireducens TaxID=568392 RepID=UPI001868518D|nr:mitochondrial fission ELM1 family protein [Nisaea nitritireducens]
MSLPADMSAWVVSDGTRGMEVQSVALARALGMDPVIKRIRPSTLLRAFPALGSWRVVPPSAGGDPLGPPWPDLVIGCGRRNAGAVLSVKGRSGGHSFAVQIQDPRIDPALFDALIVPEHDPGRGDNVIVTTASLNSLATMDLPAEAKRFSHMIQPLPGPRVLVAVGGATRRQKVEDAMVDRFVGNLEQLIDSGCGLMITASRRTPERLVEALFALGENEAAACFWNGEGENPYLGFIGAADVIVVTSDSVNMVSEACSSGKGVYVADLLVPSGRIAAFQENLRSRKLTRPFDGHVEPFLYEPLNDAVSAAEALRPMLERHLERRHR